MLSPFHRFLLILVRQHHLIHLWSLNLALKFRHSHFT